MRLKQSAAQVRRLLPVVIGGKVAVMLVGVAFLVATLLFICFAGGGDPSEAIQSTMVIPAMLVVALGCAEVVASLRATGELELAVTLASPARVILHRFAPVLTVALVQLLVVGVALAFLLPLWQVAIGWAYSFLPLALATATTLYWSLRLHGVGAVLGATLATLVPATFWIANAHLFPNSENMMTAGQVALSALRCQLGLLLATVALAALSRRRLQRTEGLLDE